MLKTKYVTLWGKVHEIDSFEPEDATHHSFSIENKCFKYYKDGHVWVPLHGWKPCTNWQELSTPLSEPPYFVRPLGHQYNAPTGVYRKGRYHGD